MEKMIILLIALLPVWGFGQTSASSFPVPGSFEYAYDSVRFYDYADEADGYWLFQPDAQPGTVTPLVVFIHGYGGYNPMIYGQWIRHLVQKGNTVIYPRYQKNLFSPAPKEFIPNVQTAIQDALTLLDTSQQHLPVDAGSLCFIGHSYGGAISTAMAADWKELNIPQPLGVLACAPGTGPFKAAKKDSYESLPNNLKLLVVVHEKDYVVGDKLGVVIFETATNTPHRNLIRQYKDYENNIPAGHNETYSLDRAFDSRLYNATTKRAEHIAEANAMDYFGYWKLADALLSCSRIGSHCEYAFGNTSLQASLGTNEEGQPLRKLEVILPKPALLSAKK